MQWQLMSMSDRKNAGNAVYRAANLESCREREREYNATHKESRAVSKHGYYQANKEEIAVKTAEYRDEHRDEINVKQKVKYHDDQKAAYEMFGDGMLGGW